MPLIDHLNDFNAAVELAQQLVISAHKVDANGASFWLPIETRFITEAAFLRIYIAWETFLEGSITAFMMDEPSLAGNAILKYVSPLNPEHAKKIIIGCNRYFEYGSHDRVLVLCNQMFKDGEPFQTVLSSIDSDLKDLRTIRNAAAHLSSTTSVPLTGLHNRLLQRNATNATVYDLIVAYSLSSPGQTILSEYILKLNTATHAIANA